MATVIEKPRAKTPHPNAAPHIPNEHSDALSRSSGDHDGHHADHEHVPTPNPSTLMHRLVMLIAVVAPFAGLGVAIYVTWLMGFMGWLYLGLLLGGCLASLLGITVSYHRLLSHRSFETVAPVRAFFTALGAMSIEGSPIRWTAVHRRHHQYSDHEGDPHSPHVHDGGVWNVIKGFCYAHIGWLFTEYWSDADTKRYVPDLYRDKVLVFMSNYYYLFVILSIAIPMAIAGAVTGTWQGAVLGALWGGLVRVFVAHHITWSINSVCHVFGSRDFHSDDWSTNNAICAMLAGGEGWHNNHHAFPSSARFGLRWYQFDLGWCVIRSLEACGLAWNVKQPSPEQIAAKAVH